MRNQSEPCACSACPADVLAAPCSTERLARSLLSAPDEQLVPRWLVQARFVWSALPTNAGMWAGEANQSLSDAQANEVAWLAEPEHTSSGFAISGHGSWRPHQHDGLRVGGSPRHSSGRSPEQSGRVPPQDGPELADICEVAPDVCEANEQVAATADGRRGGGGGDFPDERLCFAPVVRPSPASGGRWLYRSVELEAPREFDVEAAHGPFPVRGLFYHPLPVPGVANDPFPLVILIHGNHGEAWLTERAEYSAMDCIPLELARNDCVRPLGDMQPEGFKELPLYRGFDYLQAALARHGIASFSLFLNGIDSTNTLTIGQLESRGRVALSALRWLPSLTAGIKGRPPGDKRLPALDFSRVVLFGHSRGGGAALNVASSLGEGSVVGIAGVVCVAPAPIVFPSFEAPAYPLLMVTASEDEDVYPGWGAMLYDIKTPSPFKCHVFLRGANHKSFNRQTEYAWHYALPRNQKTRSMIGPAQHEESLAAYTAAFCRLVLNHDVGMNRFLLGESMPATVPADSIDLAFQVAEARTVDDFENQEAEENLVGGVNRVSGKVREVVLSGAKTFRFEFGGDRYPWPYAEQSGFGFGREDAPFYGLSRGLAMAGGTWRTELDRPFDLASQEIWLRCAVVPRVDRLDALGSRAFWLGVENQDGQVAWASSEWVGGARVAHICVNNDGSFCLDRVGPPHLVGERYSYWRRAFMRTLRFPPGCFERQPGLQPPTHDKTWVRAIIIRSPSNLWLAFDQIELVPTPINRHLWRPRLGD